MFSNQCKRNNILCYDTPYVIIQDCNQSEVVLSVKVRKKIVLFIVSQRKSGNVKESEKGQGEINV